jgi:hypothetical protein
MPETCLLAEYVKDKVQAICPLAGTFCGLTHEVKNQISA